MVLHYKIAVLTKCNMFRLECIVGPLLLDLLEHDDCMSLLVAIMCVHCAKHFDNTHNPFDSFKLLCLGVMTNMHTSCFIRLEYLTNSSEYSVWRIYDAYSYTNEINNAMNRFMPHLLKNAYRPTREAYSGDFNEHIVYLLKNACPCIEECKKGDNEFHVDCIIHVYGTELVNEILRNVITCNHIECLEVIIKYSNDADITEHIDTAFWSLSIKCLLFLLDSVSDEKLLHKIICTLICRSYKRYYDAIDTYDLSCYGSNKNICIDLDLATVIPRIKEFLQAMERSYPGHCEIAQDNVSLQCSDTWPCHVESNTKSQVQTIAPTN